MTSPQALTLRDERLGNSAYLLVLGCTEAVPAGHVVVLCGRRERPIGAANLLAGAGRTDVLVQAGGPEGWATTPVQSLQVGS